MDSRFRRHVKGHSAHSSTDADRVDVLDTDASTFPAGSCTHRVAESPRKVRVLSVERSHARDVQLGFPLIKRQVAVKWHPDIHAASTGRPTACNRL